MGDLALYYGIFFKFKKNISYLVSLIFFIFPNIANANSELNCTFDKYATAQGASMKVIKSYIPEEQNHLIKDDKSSLYLDYGLEGRVTKDTSKKVEFRYEFVNTNTNITIRYVFFRTNNKTAVYMAPQGYLDIGPVWGTCQENKNASGDYIRYSDATEEQVCNEVAIALGEDGLSFNIQITNEDGTVKNQGWIDEAKRRWGEDYGIKCQNVMRASQSPITTTSSPSKIDKAKATCTDLGFTAGTEKHGECVLKVMDN